MEELIDLHVHSIHSDGVHTPAALVEMAAKKGLRAIALADHDSVAGIDDALVAGAQHGIEIIPAIELSVEFKGYHDVHLLGYFIDHHDPSFRERLALFCARRDQRGRGIITRINEKLASEKKEGISYEEVEALVAGALGRPHIAQVLVARGLVRDVQEAFERYIIPCNVPKVYFAMGEALAEIRRLQGVAVLAHPTTLTNNRVMLKALITEMAALGLNGLEVYNNMSSMDDMNFLASVAGRLRLEMTGGSDFHGFEEGITMGSGRGGRPLPYRLLESLRRRRVELETQPLPA